MKRKLTAALLCLLLLMSTLASCGRRELDEPIEFIIANDIHYISPTINGYTLEDNVDEILYHMPSDGKLVNYIVEITDAFLAEVIEKKPRALILAGDLTMNGAAVSHAELVAKLQTVKDAGIDLLIIPGNHDVDSTAVDYSNAELKETEGTSSAKFIELYEPLMPETVSRDRDSMSYIYNASEKLWILMLDTNTYGQCYVKDSTLAWIEGQLGAAEAQGIDVISVSHQNLYAHSDLLSFGYQLYNADKLLSLYEKYSVQCNFSGHIHIQSISNDNDVPEIATSSMAITGIHYGEMVYNGRGLDYSTKSVDVSAYAKAIGSIDENLLNFASYATTVFEDTARGHATNELSGAGYSLAEIGLMAETYAKINSAYFEGREIDADDYSDGIALWKSHTGSFIAKYIDSMLQNLQGSGTSIKVKFK